MEKLSFRLPKFEGPLDALVYLISKNKLDICEISISDLLGQYLAYLDAMREMDLEITSDFLEMASRLVQIKSSMLLPKKEDEPDEKQEFLLALIEYKTCKFLARILRERATGFELITRPPTQLPPQKGYRLRHEPRELLEAFCSTSAKQKRRQAPPGQAFQKIVAGKMVSVAWGVVHVLRTLSRGGGLKLSALFRGTGGRSEAVATFLALLELVRSKTVRLEDEGEEPGVSLCRGRAARRAGVPTK